MAALVVDGVDYGRAVQGAVQYLERGQVAGSSPDHGHGLGNVVHLLDLVLGRPGAPNDGAGREHLSLH